ncbi:MAG: OmpA family protein, partial [Bacteriovoracaceae bacterium]|nr:OmpA family protein [Bacteriovoracaceae bacterium]
GKLLINENIYFSHDKSDISRSAKESLLRIAESIKDNANGVTKIVVEGHTSKAGENQYNTKLSKERAANVRKFLINNNISPELLDIVGYGEKRIIDGKKSASNRRVEFRIYQKKQ